MQCVYHGGAVDRMACCAWLLLVLGSSCNNHVAQDTPYMCCSRFQMEKRKHLHCIALHARHVFLSLHSLTRKYDSYTAQVRNSSTAVYACPSDPVAILDRLINRECITGKYGVRSYRQGSTWVREARPKDSKNDSDASLG